MVRTSITYLTALVLAATGYRFDKSWRLAGAGYKAWFYRCCCTFEANILADKWTGREMDWQGDKK